MTREPRANLSAADHFFINGEWAEPSTASTIEVINPSTEKFFYRVAEAQEADIDRAVGAARQAFDIGPWPRLSPAERAEYLVKLAAGLEARGSELSELWSGQTGVLHSTACAAIPRLGQAFRYYAALAGEYEFVERHAPSAGGKLGYLVREPVGVVGAIIPWNAAIFTIGYKVAPALLAGCTVVVKASPEAPGEAYLLAEVVEAIGLPPGVVNVVTADRGASERLVSDPRVDKISFTGSTVAGRRIASLCGDRIARYTLELGGKSAAVILDDADIGTSAASIAGSACYLSGQVCSSLTRIVVSRDRHDELVNALCESFSQVRVGDAFDPSSGMGPVATKRQYDRVVGFIAQGVSEGADLAYGGHRPTDLGRGFFIEPTVFGNVDNSSSIARQEIFGPVLSVIPADSERDAISIANDSIYGLNSAVFTNDPTRAYEVARQLRCGTVGHNAFRSDFAIAFGGFKQSGLGREGGAEGLLPYLETKTVILDGEPDGGPGV